jgi:drug/metabolite transporter (DMT)-like permease
VPPLTAIELPAALNTAQAVGIPIALVGAVFLSFGAQFQSRGVKQVESHRGSAGGLGRAQVLHLVRNRSWLFGTISLGLAIVLQLTSLRFAALIVVQPIGAIALVVTAILNARMNHIHLSRKVVRAIVLCVGGVAIFVSVAAPSATDVLAISDTELRIILLLLLVVLIVIGTLYAIFRARLVPIAYVIGAGILYGFVATMAKTVINRLAAGQFDWFTVLCVLGLAAAGLGGFYLVQTAYSVGPPDLVIAGLTVVDPIVAVGIGVLVLGEAQNAPLWAVPAFLVSGGIAVFGVFQLSRYHPEVTAREAAKAA